MSHIAHEEMSSRFSGQDVLLDIVIIFIDNYDATYRIVERATLSYDGLHCTLYIILLYTREHPECC